ncbi:MAG: hypothetical protein ACRCZF_16905 [Gemmataceae bacterium]
MPRIPSRPPLDLSGKWAVVELPSMPDDYLDLTPHPHVLISHTEFERFSATFHFGAQQGEIDGRVDEVWTHSAAIFFTFVGIDEGDEIFGAAADAGYNAADDTITGTMRYHQGDELPFAWRRASTATKSAVKRPSTGVRKKKT